MGLSCEDAGNIAAVDMPESTDVEGVVADSNTANDAQTSCPAGFFQLEGPKPACIDLPEIRYWFNETSKPALPVYGEATIYIEFDSEVVFLNESGWSELTKEALLGMLNIQHEYWSNDLMEYYADGIEVRTIDQKTVITIEALWEYDDGSRGYGKFWFGNFLLTVGNYVKREDAQKVLQSTNISDYLQNVYNQKEFATSRTCNYDPITTSQMAYENQEEEEWPSVVEDNDDEQMQFLGYLENDPNIQAQMTSLKKADPNKTYYIDVAFIISQDFEYLHPFKQRLEQSYIPRVNRIFQSSGVNVEFRVAAVERFSKYRRYLACSERLPTLDGIYSIEGVNIARELAPAVKKEHEVDLVYVFHKFGDRYSSHGIRRRKDTTAAQAARLSSVAAIHSRVSNRNYVITRLAKNFGYNLGLSNEEQRSEFYPDPTNFTGYGHGYKRVHNIRPAHLDHRIYVSTMMASPRTKYGYLPLFSSNEILTKSEICRDDPFMNPSYYSPGFGFCHVSGLPGSYRMRIGDSVANSSEALQYTIEDASNYSDYSPLPEDEES